MADERGGPGGASIRQAEAALAAILGISVDELRDPARSGPALADAVGDASRWLRDAVLGDADERRSAEDRWSKLKDRLATSGVDLDDAPDDLVQRLRSAVPTREAIDALRQSAARSDEAAVELNILGMRAAEWLKVGAERLRDWADRLAEADRTARPRPDLRVVVGGAGDADEEGEEDVEADADGDAPEPTPSA